MTVKELQRQRLKDYLECERCILVNQEYQIGSRTYRRADLSEVRKMIQALLAEGVTLEDDDLTAYKGRQARAVFID